MIRDGKATVSELWMNLKNCLASSKIDFCTWSRNQNQEWNGDVQSIFVMSGQYITFLPTPRLALE